MNAHVGHDALAAEVKLDRVFLDGINGISNITHALM
jgi:hypothetical protein